MICLCSFWYISKFVEKYSIMIKVSQLGSKHSNVNLLKKNLKRIYQTSMYPYVNPESRFIRVEYKRYVLFFLFTSAHLITLRYSYSWRCCSHSLFDIKLVENHEDSGDWIWWWCKSFINITDFFDFH